MEEKKTTEDSPTKNGTEEDEGYLRATGKVIGDGIVYTGKAIGDGFGKVGSTMAATGGAALQGVGKAAGAIGLANMFGLNKKDKHWRIKKADLLMRQFKETILNKEFFNPYIKNIDCLFHY